MDQPVIDLKLTIDPASGALRVEAVLGPDDLVGLGSLAQLSEDHAPGAPVVLRALDFTDKETAYRVFAATLEGEGAAATPWAAGEGGCQYSFTMPEKGHEGPRFAIAAFPVNAAGAVPIPFVSGGEGAAGGLPIKVVDPGGPGPTPH